MTLYKFKFMALLCAVMFVVLGPRAFSDDTNWTATKTIDGHPDLQGVWGNNTITPLHFGRGWIKKNLYRPGRSCFKPRWNAEGYVSGTYPKHSDIAPLGKKLQQIL
jgi:hypothetical protein